MSVLDKQYYQKQIKRSLTGKYQPHGDPSKGDCVIGVGFGFRVHEGKVLPSMTTRQIATAVHQFEHLPKILSHDVATAYKKLFPHDAHQVWEIIHPKHLSNARLANEIRDHMYFKQYKQGILIAHQHHLPWFDYLCGQINVPTIVPPGLKFAFDPVSALPWTRDEASWQAEIKARLDRGFDESYHEYSYRLHHS